MNRREEIIYRPGLMANLAKSRVVFSPDGGNAGDGGDNNMQQGNNNQQQQNNNNNNQDNSDNFEKLWENDDTDGEDIVDKDKRQGQQQQQSDTDNRDTQFTDYLKSINFMEGVDVRKLVDDAANGRPESMEQALTSVAQNAYKRALGDATKVMDVKIQRAVDQAVQKAGVNVNANMAVSTMESRLKYTTDPALNPIARAVLGQLMKKKGVSLDEAIQGVDKYFSRTSQLVNKGKTAPRGRPGNRQFTNQDTNNDSSDEGDEDLDWMRVLQA